MNELNKIKDTIRRAVVTRAGDDSGAYHICQITYNKKTVPAEVINPYGLYTNPPNGLQTMMFTVCGDSENRAIIAYSQGDRFKDLKEGEVLLGHTGTQSFIKFDNDGNVEIDSKAKVKVTAASEVEITVTGDVKVNAINVKLNAATVDLGVAGKAIAREGDPVQVSLLNGTGTITSGGINTSL